jgi:hypothetical protein
MTLAPRALLGGLLTAIAIAGLPAVARAAGPELTLSSGTLTWTQADNAAATPVAIDPDLTVTDPDALTLASATVTMSMGAVLSEDVLGFTNDAISMGDIAGTFDQTTGIMTLTGSSATITQWENALRSVTYTDILQAGPNSGTRGIDFALDDLSNQSLPVTKFVNLMTPDQSPVVTTSSGAAAWASGDNEPSRPVVVDGGLTVSDTDDGGLFSATVAITGNFQQGEDLLGFSNSDTSTYGDISGVYDPDAGTMLLTSAGSATTMAQWQAALAAVTYTDTAVTPTTATRTISFTGNDFTKDGPTATRQVTVTATDQTPIVTTSGGQTEWTQGDNVAAEPVVVDSDVTVTDGNNTTMASAKAQIVGGLQTGEDVLAFTNDDTDAFGDIDSVYDASTGLLFLTSHSGTPTVAQWQNALAAVTYTDAAVSPDTGNRRVAFSADDGINDSGQIATRKVTLTTVDQSPVVTTSSGSATWVEADNQPSTPVVVDDGVTVNDTDTPTLASVDLTITGNYQQGEDALGYVNDGVSMGDITGTFDPPTGTMALSSLSGTATFLQWQNAMAAVTYTDGAVAPTRGLRTISFIANDGTKDGPAATRTVTVAATDQTPTVTTSGGSTAWTQGDNTPSTPVVVDGDVRVTDGNDAVLASAKVLITDGLQTGEDVLAFTNDDADAFGDIDSLYSTNSGVLFLSSASGTTTVAQWQAALAAVTYTDSAAFPDTGTRTVAFKVDDATNASQAATHQVTLAATDQSPVVATSGGPTAWTQGDNVAASPVVVDGGVTVADADNGTLASAAVTITGNYQEGEDVLDFVSGGDTMGNVSGSFDPTTGVETLTSAGSTATIAEWRAALAAVTYTDTASSQDTDDRTVSFTANDGTQDGPTATKTVTVASVGQSPVVTTTGGTTAWVEAIGGVPTTPVKVDHTIIATDADSTSLPGATVAITGSLHSAEDVLAFTNDGTTMGDVTASYVAGTGVLTLESVAGASPAQWQAALRAVTYADTASAPDTDTRTITFTLDDGAHSGSGDQALSVTATDQTPAPPAAPVAPVTPPVVPVAPPKLPVSAPLAKVTLHVALPTARRASVRTTARGHLKVACTVATAKAATCTVDVFATDPAKASAAAVRGRVLGRGKVSLRAGHRGTVQVDVALNANGRSLVRRHPHGVSVEVRITASSKGLAPATLTRQVRLLG